jgi:hypothetical protein
MELGYQNGDDGAICRAKAGFNSIEEWSAEIAARIAAQEA